MEGVKLTASDLLAMLARRHADDVFVPEVTCGRGGGLRLDAWAHRRTWTRGACFGYEIKVSRGDWIGDEKLLGYLEFCESLYVVCPWGLVAVDEVPPEVGLVWATKTGGRLVTKKKAPVRRVEKLTAVLLSVLINRVRSGPLTNEVHARTQVEYWEERLAHKERGRRVGSAVHGAIRERMRELEARNRELVETNRGLQRVREFLEANELDTAWRPLEKLWEMKEKSAMILRDSFSDDDMAALRGLSRSVGEILERAENPSTKIPK